MPLMEYGEKFAYGRTSANPPRTQEEVVDYLRSKGFADANQKNYQSVELSRSLVRAKAYAPHLHELFGFYNHSDKPKGQWFFEKEGTNPYRQPVASRDGVEYDDPLSIVDIGLHVPYISGKVSISMNQMKTVKLATGLARNKTTAMVAPNDANAPRVLPGQILFFEAKDSYDEGDLVAVDHPTELVEGPDGKKFPSTIIGRYRFRDGAMCIVPDNPSHESILAQGLFFHGVAKVRRIPITEDWWMDEVCLSGLPTAVPA